MRGILINNELHTAKDLNLVMTAKDLPAPQIQTYTVEVPGRNGLLDLSEFLTGEPTYSNRTLTFDFIGDGSRATVLSLIDKMLSYHGRNITVTTDDFPGWYYTGRAEITYVDSGHYVNFTLKVNAQPFSFALTPTTYTCKSTSTEGETINLHNRGVTVYPTVTVDMEAIIIKGETTIHLSGGAGTYSLDGLKLVNGDNFITVKTDGTVIFSYREAVI